MRRVWLMLALAALAAVALTGCFGGGDDDEPVTPAGQDAVSTPGAEEPSTPSANDGSAAGDDGTPGDETAAPSPDAGEDAEAGEPAEPVDAEPSDQGEPAEPVDAEPTDGGETEPDAPPPGVPGVTGAALFPQPDPSVRTDTLPARPADFADYPSTLLPWLQGRFLIPDLIPLGTEWALPAVAHGGDRWHLVDTDADASGPGDGLSSTVLVLTDPATLGEAMVGSNLVIYDPLPDQPGVFRLVYDHNALKGLRGETPESFDVVVRSVEDATGDEIRDVTFEETVCGESGCEVVRWVLVSEGEGYRAAAMNRGAAPP